MPTDKSFDTGELELSYYEGPESGPPLVLLHGLTAQRQAWDPFLPLFTPDWHVYTIDLRGHGQSGRDGANYKLSDYVRDIVAFVRAQVAESPVIMGHSLGALVAMGTGAELGDGARGLVLLDPPLYNRNLSINETPGPMGWFSFIYETMKLNPSFERVVDACLAMTGGDRVAANGMATQIYNVAAETGGVAIRDELFAGYDPEAALKKITCPTLLLRGEWDMGAAIRDEDAEFVAANVADVKVFKLDSAPHDFPWSRMDETLGYVQGFLQALPGSKK